MNIRILFDQKSSSGTRDGGWGFSALINEEVLFDTGANGKRLIKNMEQFGINIADIRSIVISHNHWDHQGGLSAVLARAGGIDLWLGKEEFNLRQVKKMKIQGKYIRHPGFFSEICENIFTTGEIEGKFLWKKIQEQSLVIMSNHQLNVVTGCAHPGILKVLEVVRKQFKEKINLVAGGFHLFGTRKAVIKSVIKGFKEMGVRKVAPCHCTGNTAIRMFEEAFGHHFISVKVGALFTI